MIGETSLLAGPNVCLARRMCPLRVVRVGNTADTAVISGPSSAHGREVGRSRMREAGGVCMGCGEGQPDVYCTRGFSPPENHTKARYISMGRQVKRPLRPRATKRAGQTP
jgi:hypothetical protein